MLLGTTTTATVTEKIAYVIIPLRRVRVLSFAYGGFLGNQSEENSRLIIDELARALQMGEADVALLSYVRTDSPLRQAAINPPSALMRDYFPVNQSHWMMDIPENVEAIYAGLSREHRKKLRAEAKKLRETFGSDLRFVRYDRPDQMEQLIKDTEKVAATTYQRGLGVGFSETRQVRELLALEASKGWLRGYLLYVGDRPCAFWIGCIYKGVFLSEYLGHDPAYARHSPGTYVLVQAMEDLCRDRVRKIDLGIGESLYKQRFGNRSFEESAISLYAPTLKGMQVKAVRTGAVLVNRTAKKLLHRSNAAARLKKAWRNRLMRAENPRS